MSRSDLAVLAQPEAERLARETWDAVAWAWRGRMEPGMTEWAHLDAQIREIHTSAHVALLTDLSRPASMDWWARWLAERVGLTCGATAPDWARFVCGEHSGGDDGDTYVSCREPIWSLMGASEVQMATFASCGQDGNERFVVPGISSVTDPADALRLAVLAVAGGSR